MKLLGAILILVALMFVSYHYWDKLSLEEEKPKKLRWFKAWVIKGLGLPILVWIICNLGSSPIVPPMVAAVAVGKVTSGLGRIVALTAPAVAIMASYWTAVTFAWFVGSAFARMTRRRELLIGALGWSLLAIPLAVGFIAMLGWESAGFVGLLALLPVLHYGVMLPELEPLPTPSYAKAIAKMKFGKYSEAESEVIAELERCENDFDGWMLLAELYANHFHDLREADQTVRELATEPKTTPSQIAVAFHRLADWHLKLGGDPFAARRALEAIGILLPGTHLAHMAQLRLNKLPATREELAEQRERRPVRLPVISDALDESGASEVVAMDPKEATALANGSVEKLNQDSNDVAAREQLARLLAEQLGQARAGIDQLELLIHMPNQPEPKMAAWLALIASWQLTYCQDPEAARSTLENLVHQYPQSAEAFAAQRRLTLMAVEARAERMKSAAKRLRLPTR
jgi:hypothetical protein